MSIHEFELFHGIVLTKLLRSDKPISLRMVETRPDDAWSIYRLNDEVDLLIKVSTNHRPYKKGRSWSFVFSPDQLHQVEKSDAKGGVYIALVGGSLQVKDSQRCVCLLDPEEIKEILEFPSSKQQALTIRFIPGKYLQVVSGRIVRCKVPQNKLDNWEIPGG